MAPAREGVWGRTEALPSRLGEVTGLKHSHVVNWRNHCAPSTTPKFSLHLPLGSNLFLLQEEPEQPPASLGHLSCALLSRKGGLRGAAWRGLGPNILSEDGGSCHPVLRGEVSVRGPGTQQVLTNPFSLFFPLPFLPRHFLRARQGPNGAGRSGVPWEPGRPVVFGVGYSCQC